MKAINNELIRSFSPCYDPSEKGIPDSETLPVLEWIEKYRTVVPTEDIFWLLLRTEFISDKDLRLFAVWCARETLKLVKKPDIRSIEACNVAEKFANGEATKEELYLAREAAALAAAGVVAWATTWTVAVAAAWEAAWEAAREAWEAGWTVHKSWEATREAIRNKQLDYLINKIKQL